MSDLNELLHRYRQKDRRALSRLLTLAGQSDDASLIRRHIERGSGRVVVLTGSGGVGKSSLLARLVETLRQQDQTVGVLACDPQSPLTGGALLGDRLRMAGGSPDEGLFVRSLAAAAGQQGLAENLDIMLDLLLGFGFDWVLLETVGAGQTDTEARRLCDVLVLLLQPESGDTVQWEKAGLLEVADVVVINKADLPGADRMEAQLREELNLPGFRTVPVLKTSAVTGEGIEELWRLVASFEPNAER